MEGRDFDDIDVSGGGGRIPVFCFPSTLVFNGADREQLKQILTIYNPYDFPIRFRVLSTTPDYYNVMSPEGSINSKNCIDLIIRLTSDVPTVSSHSLESKFRIQVFNYNTKQALGRKDVPSTILYGQNVLSSDFLPNSADAFQNFVSETSEGSRSGRRHQRGDHRESKVNQDYSYVQPNNINYVAIVTGIVCILGLLLPLDKDEPSTILPSYLHLSVNQKLLIAYTLGLVTMVLFRH